MQTVAVSAPDMPDDTFAAWDLAPFMWEPLTPPSPLTVLTTAAHTMPLLNVSLPSKSVAITSKPPSAKTMKQSSVPVVTYPKQTNIIPPTEQAWKEKERMNLIPTPSRAMGFMTTRPGGPIQEQNRNMKAKERQVLAHVQTKSTSSTTGRKALVELTATMTRNSTDNTKVVSGATKRKAPHSTKPKQTKQRNEVKTSGNDKAQGDIREKRPTCMYGCQHVGWVELLQMTPNNTKYSLGKGNFFYGKQCTDCKIPIASLFEASKNKALFYYCPVDYNLSELDDENNEFAAKSCACILCIPCYFERDTNQTAATTTRKSGRARIRK
jgi:hypothetical protein